MRLLVLNRIIDKITKASQDNFRNAKTSQKFFDLFYCFDAPTNPNQMIHLLGINAVDPRIFLDGIHYASKMLHTTGIQHSGDAKIVDGILEFGRINGFIDEINIAKFEESYSNPQDGRGFKYLNYVSEKPVFATYIRLLRLSKRLSQEELANKMGTTKSYISQIELGQRSPTFANIEKFAEAFEMRVNPELFIEKPY